MFRTAPVKNPRVCLFVHITHAVTNYCWPLETIYDIMTAWCSSTMTVWTRVDVSGSSDSSPETTGDELLHFNILCKWHTKTQDGDGAHQDAEEVGEQHIHHPRTHCHITELLFMIRRHQCMKWPHVTSKHPVDRGAAAKTTNNKGKHFLFEKQKKKKGLQCESCVNLITYSTWSWTAEPEVVLRKYSPRPCPSSRPSCIWTQHERPNVSVNECT